jgi:hypothetical protein
MDEVSRWSHHKHAVEMMNCNVMSGRNSIRKPKKEVSGLTSIRNIGIYCKPMMRM